MEVQGKLIKKDVVKEFGSNGFRKRDIVLKTDEQYPQEILIELHQDNVDLIKDFKKDETIKVSINLRGRAWTNPKGEVVYFNSLVGWRIERVAISEPAPTSTINSTGTGVKDDDDLPF